MNTNAHGYKTLTSQYGLTPYDKDVIKEKLILREKEEAALKWQKRVYAALTNLRKSSRDSQTNENKELNRLISASKKRLKYAIDEKRQRIAAVSAGRLAYEWGCSIHRVLLIKADVDSMAVMA